MALKRTFPDSLYNSEIATPDRLIIAGSRGLFEGLERSFVVEAVDEMLRARGVTPEAVEEVVSGHARGPDTAGEWWAKANGIPIADERHAELDFEPEWEDLSHPDARIKTRADGTQYDANAGHRRNERMAEYGTALMAFWKGTPGTQSMIEFARSELGDDNIAIEWLGQ